MEHLFNLEEGLYHKEGVHNVHFYIRLCDYLGILQVVTGTAFTISGEPVGLTQIAKYNVLLKEEFFTIATDEQYPDLTWDIDEFRTLVQSYFMSISTEGYDKTIELVNQWKKLEHVRGISQKTYDWLNQKQKDQ